MLDLSISKLEARFSKIDFDDYALSYSGGKDSHLLYWFIKDYLKDDKIKIVGVDTYREHSEIRERIYKNCDKVLTPELSMKKINEIYGMPCFSKIQDGFIHEYQRGSNAKSITARVERTPNIVDGREIVSHFALNKKASELTVSGKLHKVSNKCCDYTKKIPMKKYAKENDKKYIIGVRASEGIQRKAKYTSCLSKKDNKFTPLFDFTDADVTELYDYYNIEIPNIYKNVSRTGCVGCPYARSSELIRAFSYTTKSQQKYALDSFGESYKVKGIYMDLLLEYQQVKLNI